MGVQTAELQALQMQPSMEESMTHTITLTQEQVERLQALNETRNKSLNELATQTLDLGLQQLEYRTKRNREKAQEMKEFRQWKKQQA